MKKYRNLTRDDRLHIEFMINRGYSQSEIARQLGFSRATICRELQRARYIHTKTDLSEEERYNPDKAQRLHEEKLKNCGPNLKIGNDLKLLQFIENEIVNNKSSPYAALEKIKKNNIPFKTSICLSTCYNYIRNGIFLNVSLEDCPSPRRKRKKKVVVRKRRSLQPKCSSIEKRDDRINLLEDVGHWEMDTVVGRKERSKCILVLTERYSLKEKLLLLNRKTSKEVVRALDCLERKMGTEEFRNTFKSITCDNGVEFFDYSGIQTSYKNKTSRTKLYLCHPYSSWERGRNEVNNRFIRRFYPKGKSMNNLTMSKLHEIESFMNDYPREKYGGLSSNEVYEKILKRQELV